MTLSGAPPSRACFSRESAVRAGRQLLAHGLGDVRLVGDAGHAVGAEHPPVAGTGRHDERVDLGVRVHIAEHAHQNRSARVEPRLLGRDAAGLDETLHEGVVGRDLGELAVAVEIDARVADVRDNGVLVDHDDAADGRAEPRQLGLARGGVDEILGRGDDRLAQRLFRLAGGVEVPVEVLQPVDGDGRGDVSARVAAHSVGHDEEIRAGIARILVVRPHASGVTDRGAGALEDHSARATSAARTSWRRP